MAPKCAPNLSNSYNIQLLFMSLIPLPNIRFISSLKSLYSDMIVPKSSIFAYWSQDYFHTPQQLNSLPNSISPFIYKFRTLTYEFHPEIVLIHFDVKLFCSQIL